MNTFVKTIAPSKVSEEFLRCLNGLVGLTPKELKVFSIFLEIHMESVKSRKPKASLDNRYVRKDIMTRTGTTRENLSRYIKTFKLKGILIEVDGVTTMNKALVPEVISGKTVQITMVLKIKEDGI